MLFMHSGKTCSFLGALLAAFAFLQPSYAALNKGSLDSEVQACAKTFTGRLGVGVIEIKSGKTWFFNGNDRFRMQSVAKVPVAIAALQQVDEGKLKLDEAVPLTKADVASIRLAAIPDPLPANAKSATLSSLLERSICRSNNGATDVMIKKLGGPAAINSVFRKANISGIRLDRYEFEVVKQDDDARYTGMPDSSTPRAACDLLQKLQTGKLLSQQSTTYLIDLMRRCETGKNRIRAGFPQAWTVADKTGTGRQAGKTNVATNDVAIIESPDKSIWILTVFVGDAKLTPMQCEQKICDVANIVYRSIK